MYDSQVLKICDFFDRFRRIFDTRLIIYVLYIVWYVMLRSDLWQIEMVKFEC